MKYILLFVGILLFGQSVAQNNWTSTSGPFGGYVSNLRRSPSGTLFTIVNQRLYQSTNNADTWSITPTTTPSTLYLNDVMVDTDGTMYAVYFSQLYKSVDNGIIWTSVVTNQFQSAYGITRVGPDDVFVVWGGAGLYTSVDKGLTWKQLSNQGWSGLPGLWSNNAGDIFYATQEGKLYRHLYQGLTPNWDSSTLTNTGLTLTNDQVNSMTIDASGKLYVSSFYDFFVSTNNGTSFTSIKSKFTLTTYFNGPLGVAPNGNLYFFSNSNYDPNTNTSPRLVYKSTDSGNNWTSSLSPSDSYGTEVKNVVFASSSMFFAGTSGDGVFRTSDSGATWAFKSTGLTGANTTGIVVANTTNRIIVVKGARGYWTSTDGGTTWNISVLSDYASGVLKLSDGTIIIYGSKVFRSTDNGATFSADLNYYSHYKIVEAANGDLYGFRYGKVSRSTDKGVTWTDLAITGLPATFQPYEAAIDGTTNIICHGYDGVSAYKTYKIVGTTATQLTLPFTSSLNNIFFHDNKFFATQFSAYYTTTDLGTNWTTVGFSGNVVLPLKQGAFIGIAVSKQGSFQVTQDNGGTWNNTNLPVSSAYITDVATDSNGDYYATAYGSSVLKFTNDLLVDPATLPPYINFNWQPLNGPYGGNVSKIELHPDGITLFAISQNRLWKYSGGLWTRLDPVNPGGQIFDVEIDATGAIYALPVVNPQKVYKSTNGGTSWSPLTSTGLPAASANIRRIEVLSNGSILAFGTNTSLGRIYKSSNGGNSFTLVYSSAFNVIYGADQGSSAARKPTISPTNGTIAIMGDLNEGMLISTDNGTTWTAKSVASIATPTGFVGSYMYDKNGHLVSQSIVDSNLNPLWDARISKSTDDGTTWTTLPTPPITNAEGTVNYSKRVIVLGNGEYLMCAQSLFDCYRSTDGGATWTNIGNVGDVFLWAVSQGSTSYIVGSGNAGILKTTDGGLTFSTFSDGIPHPSANSINLINNNLLIGATRPYYSADLGQSFTLATLEPATSYLPVGDSLVGYGSRLLLSSKDGGKTWKSFGTDRFLTFLTADATGNGFYGSNGGTLGYSTDLLTWINIELSGLPENYSIRNMVIDQGGVIYAVIQDFDTGLNDVYKIVFGSATKISNTIGTTSPATIKYYNEKIYLYDSNGIIYKSEDGDTWTQVSAPAGNSLIITNNYLFIAGTNSVLWLSRNDGEAWQSVGDVPISGVVSNFQNVVVNEYDGYAYATLTNSVARRSGNIVIPDDNTKPIASTLSPAPNSTNISIRPTLTITFDEITNIVAGKKLRIFDLTQPALPVITMDVSEAIRSEKSWTFTLSSDLSYLKTYFVIVEVGAFADIFGNTFNGITSNSAWRLTIQEEPDTQAPAIVIATADLKQTKGAAKRVDITVTDNKNLPVDKTKVYYRGIAKLDTEPFTPATLSVLSGGGTISTTFTIEAQDNWYDEMGLEFYFEAEDASGNKKRSPITANTYYYSYITYPVTSSPVLPSARISLGGKANNYRMITIPFELADPQLLSVLDELGIEDNKKWRIFTYAGGDQFTENPPSFIRGKGYWINVKSSPGEIKIDGATTPSNNRTDFFKMNLTPGWNQIGNPYPVEINWDEIRTPNAAIGKLKVFNGSSYNDESSLLPYQGAFVFVTGTTPINNVVVRFKGITTGGRLASNSAESDLSKPDWVIPISAVSNEITNSMGGVGMNEHAHLEWDQFDDVNPPRFIDYAELAFNKKYNTYPLAKDVVPTQDEYVWEFSVNASEGQTQLIWDNTAITGDKDLLLFDLDRQKLIDMKLTASYSFNAKEGNSFSIHFGKDLHINPTAVTLGNPFPNPTNSSATIGFTLPESKSPYQVQLEVYNSVGQRAAVLVNSNLQSGFYTSSWDTENNKTGLYFYRLSVTAKGTQKVLTQKIIINR